ncbi:tudor and KH domain-containing protein homolog [Chironomus tepperi]|uniref:tudor and KH domain-containing protein homolog n=1 Tax=Chironomus tepperi TaxID=113505 RepID=UPI00391FB01D
MKSVLPIAAGIIGVSALIYIYIRQRDKDKKKKPDNDNSNGTSNKNDTAVESLEFKVDNNLVPLIVGRNSVNLKLIEEKTKTQIKFRSCDDDNQMCTINGKINDVKTAKQLIDAEAQKQPIITDEILVPTSSCGKIEGYSGSVLHDICQKSSAKVWVDPATRKVQGENRRVLITGTKEQVAMARALIEEKMNEPAVEQSLQVDDKKEKTKSPSPFASNSSITTTETPREVMLPSPEKFKTNDGQLEVYVSAVASPSRFWVQISGPQNSELDFLVDAMTEYYNQKENQALHAIREPYLGQIVAAMFLADNKWYRAEIVAIQPNSDDLVLDVYFLDYGDQQFVGRKEILELRADFLSLRFQAIECFLAHVQPTNTGSKFEEWDRQAIDKFEEIVQAGKWKKMISKVVTYKDKKSFALQRPSNKRESSPVPGVELYEENSDRNIALELVDNGFAEMSDRFGDLAKSSVLKIADDVKEISPEPMEIVEKSSEVKDDSKKSSDVTPESIEFISDPIDIISEPEELFPEPEDMLLEPEEKFEEISPKGEETTNNNVEDSPQSLVPEKPKTIPEKISSESNQNTVIESKVPEPTIEETKPLADHNKNNIDPQSFSNGAQSQKAKPESNFFGGSNSSQVPQKKKKKLTTADFLKNEQENAAKKYKTDDWNSMMDE